MSYVDRENKRHPLMLHPAYGVVDNVEVMWAMNKFQQWQRTSTVVRALVEAGIIDGGQWIDGCYRVKDESVTPLGRTG